MAAFGDAVSNALPVPQSTSLDIEGDYAALGGLGGQAALYSVKSNQLERELPIGEPVTDTLWVGSKLIFASSLGTVKVFEGGSEVASLAEHAGPATGLSGHPGGELLASVGSDKSVVFYDLNSYKRVSRAYAGAGEFPSPSLGSVLLVNS